MLTDEGVERLPGAHCYEVYAGAAAFAAITDEELGTFFLTDFLARYFDRLVVKGLGLAFERRRNGYGDLATSLGAAASAASAASGVPSHAPAGTGAA